MIIKIELLFYLDSFLFKKNEFLLDFNFLANNWKTLDSSELNTYFKIFPYFLEKNDFDKVLIEDYFSFLEIKKILEKFAIGNSSNKIPEKTILFEFE